MVYSRRSIDIHIISLCVADVTSTIEMFYRQNSIADLAAQPKLRPYAPNFQYYNNDFVQNQNKTTCYSGALTTINMLWWLTQVH